MRRISIDCGVLWVCQCCTLQHANGECCDDREHGGDGVEPWSRIDFARFAVGMGLPWEYHEDVCERRFQGGVDCDCEVREFDRARCDGCNSWSGGYRHAFLVTREQQKFSTGVLPA